MGDRFYFVILDKKDLTFLDAEKISDSGWNWTKDIENAKEFTTISDARKQIDYFTNPEDYLIYKVTERLDRDFELEE